MLQPRSPRTGTDSGVDMPHPSLMQKHQYSDTMSASSLTASGGEQSGHSDWRPSQKSSMTSDLPNNLRRNVSQKSVAGSECEASKVSFAPCSSAMGSNVIGDKDDGKNLFRSRPNSVTSNSGSTAKQSLNSPLSSKLSEDQKSGREKKLVRPSGKIGNLISEAYGRISTHSHRGSGGAKEGEGYRESTLQLGGMAPKTGVFADATALKQKVLQNLTKPEYNVFDFYHKTGYAQAVAKSPIFEQITIIIISLNALWIMVDTDNNDAKVITDAKPIFVVAENVFCSYFTFEWLIRFCAFKFKRNCIRDGWFVFDSMLVALMVLETWVIVVIITVLNLEGNIGDLPAIKLFRLVRLSRVARMARLLKTVPELMILIKGMAAAMRSVMFTLLLLALNIYVFAIFFTQLCQEATTTVRTDYFENVWQSMYTLLLRGVLLDSPSYVTEALGKENPIFVFLFFIFVLVAALTVMNLLIGVLVEVVGVVAAVEKEEMLVSLVKSRLQSIVEELDENGDNKISRAEFSKILESADAANALSDVGVDVVGLVDYADFIFDPGNAVQDEEEVELNFGEFMAVVLSLRGSNTATVKDVVDLRKYVRTAMQQNNNSSSTKIEDCKQHINRKLEEHFVRIEKLIKDPNRRPGIDNYHITPVPKSKLGQVSEDNSINSCNNSSEEKILHHSYLQYEREMLYNSLQHEFTESSDEKESVSFAANLESTHKENLKKLGEFKSAHLDQHRLPRDPTKMNNRSKQHEGMVFSTMAENWLRGKQVAINIRSPTKPAPPQQGDAGLTPRDSARESPRELPQPPMNGQVILERTEEDLESPLEDNVNLQSSNDDRKSRYSSGQY